jgi:hypothetical protein
MAAMISTNLTKKQRIRNFSSPLRDNSTSMDCWSSGNPLLDEFATSQEDLPPCLLRTVTGWQPDTVRAIDLQEVLRTSSSSATVDVCPSVNRDRDGFEREPDFSDTVRRVREWHSRLRQMIRPRRKLQRETFYAFVRASIHSPLRAVADLLARQGIEKARLTCVCCAYSTHTHWSGLMFASASRNPLSAPCRCGPARASGNREGSSHLCVLCVHTLIGQD